MTLCVIFATLVLQGLSFPMVIRGLGVQEDDESSREELVARKAAARAALDRIEQLRAEPWTREDSADRLRAIYEFRFRRLAQRAGTLDEDENLDERSIAWQRMVRDVLEAQRQEVVRLRDDGRISDDVLSGVMRELDLEDQRLRDLTPPGGQPTRRCPPGRARDGSPAGDPLRNHHRCRLGQEPANGRPSRLAQSERG